MFRKKKQEQAKQFQYTSLDNLSPDLQSIFALREIDNDLNNVETELRGLIEKRKLLLEHRQALIMQIQAPRPHIPGLDSIFKPQQAPNQAPIMPESPQKRGRKPRGDDD